MRTTGARPTLAAAAAVALVLSAVPAPRSGGQPAYRPVEGRDTREPVDQRPAIEAAFVTESYRRGDIARLTLYDEAGDVKVRVYRVGGVGGRLRRRDVMLGTQMGPTRVIRAAAEGAVIRIRLDARWPSGLYFAQLTGARHRVGYAPFVLAPQTLGEHRIGVVLPTQTWQAYNFRDDDGNGVADSMYASSRLQRARLIRPYQNRGVPPHFRKYDEPFVRWLVRRRYAVDYLSDRELRSANGASLAHAYELLVFAGHHEYVTKREYDAVTGFRDRGGNLIFLSANNFYYEVAITHGAMTRIGAWRRLGRPEAALVGSQYFGSSTRPGSPWVVKAAPAARWIFRGTGLEPGSAFSSGGIEADCTDAASPAGTQVIAEIPNVFGTGKDAQMTYYEAPSGARVFAAGAFTLAGSVWQPTVQKMVANLIDELSRPARDTRGYTRRT